MSQRGYCVRLNSATHHIDRLRAPFCGGRGRGSCAHPRRLPAAERRRTSGCCRAACRRAAQGSQGRRRAAGRRQRALVGGGRPRSCARAPAHGAEQGRGVPRAPDALAEPVLERHQPIVAPHAARRRRPAAARAQPQQRGRQRLQLRALRGAEPAREGARPRARVVRVDAEQQLEPHARVRVRRLCAIAARLPRRAA